ncbi:MAG: coiled-coil domain-containing protein [Nitrososphaerales archaeon]
MQPQGEVDLEAISQKIDSLSSQRLDSINEYRRLDQRRREIRGEIRGFTEKINVDRKALDEYYDKISSFKNARREILSKIRDMKTKSTEVEKVLKKFEKSAPKEGEALNERLKKVEWKLQTERLTRDEEKQLVANVKELETKLKAWRKAHSTKQDLGEILGQIKILKKQLDEMNVFKAQNDPEVKATHERVATMLNQRHELFQEIEEIDQKLVNLETNISTIVTQLDEFYSQRRAMLDGKRSKEHESNRAKTRELVERVKGDARKKLEQGAKLSFDELKLVYADDPEAINK